MHPYKHDHDELPGYITFWEASPEAKKLIRPVCMHNNTLGESHNEKWPISILTVGECFIIPRSWVKQVYAFRQHMIKRGDSVAKGIVVIYHRKHKIIEVARIY